MFDCDRRGFLALVPATALGLRGFSPGLPPVIPAQGSFRALASRFIAAPVRFVHTDGHAARGDGGHGIYVSDHLATPALAALAPLLCTQSADGRIWRAATGADGLVPVRAGGAIGWSSPAEIDFATNHQPAIAQAMAYMRATGARGLAFDRAHYAIRTPRRTAPDDNVNRDKSGIPFLIEVPTVFRAAPGGTTFHRRKFDGSDPADFRGTQWLPGNNADHGHGNGHGMFWRGGMFFLVGRPTPPSDRGRLASLLLEGDWTIDGGIPMSPEPGLLRAGNPPYYVLRSDGAGWDVSDKAIWAEQDRHTGDIRFNGRIRIGGFRGELIYQGGRTHGSIYQTGELTLHDTDGDGFNPGPTFSQRTGLGTVRMQSLRIVRAAQALEGSTGWASRIDRLEIDACTHAGGLVAGEWGRPPPPGSPPPLLAIGDLRITRSGNFFALTGNHIARMTVVDGPAFIGQGNLVTHDVEILHLTIVADRTTISDGVTFVSAGRTRGARSTFGNHIGTVTLAQSPAARAAGRLVINPVGWLNSLGDGNRVDLVEGIAARRPFSRVPESVLDETPRFGQVRATFTGSR